MYPSDPNLQNRIAVEHLEQLRRLAGQSRLRRELRRQRRDIRRRSRTRSG